MQMTSTIYDSVNTNSLTRVWRPRVVLIVAVSITVVLILPPSIYAYLAYLKFNVFNPSYYIPYEELFATMQAGSVHDMWHASLVVVNMTSGLLLANMYTLALGQLLLSTALGVIIGLTLEAHLVLHRVCPRGALLSQSAGATGTGLLATIAASSAGIFGCCGSALAGGVLTLAGVSSATAIQVADLSIYAQTAVIILFAANYVRLRRRVKSLGGHVA